MPAVTDDSVHAKRAVDANLAQPHRILEQILFDLNPF